MGQKVLVTSSSFIDTPGPHLDKLNSCSFDLIHARGPLEEEELIKLFSDYGGFDGVLCGTDYFTEKVLRAAHPRTKVISRNGVGLDRIDIETAQHLGIEVFNTPRFNHATVAEFTMGLILNASRKISDHINIVKSGKWLRMTGHEIDSKTLAIFGFGMVGREVAKLALSFGMNVIINNSSWGEVHEEYFRALKSNFKNPLLWNKSTIERCQNEDETLARADYISLHLDLNRYTQHFINEKRLSICKTGAFIVNVSRGALVDEVAITNAVISGKISGYTTDVIEKQPIKVNNPLLSSDKIMITPHIAGRTYDSVYKQGLASVDNLLNILKSQA